MAVPTLWIDITELFDHFAVADHSTGISRVVLSLAHHLGADPGAYFGSVRPIFWHPVRRRPLTFASGPGPLPEFFLSLRERYAEAGLTAQYRSRAHKAFVTAVPKPLRFGLFPSTHGVTRFAAWARQADVALEPVRFARGDCLFLPGSFWLGRYAPAMIGQARGPGATIVAFVHDVLLLSNPEWMGGRHGEQFRRGVGAVLPQCDAVLCNSDHTARSLRNYISLAPDLDTQVCRLADVFETPPEGLQPDLLPPAVAALGARPYALFVSTIVPRKNHKLLVDAWIELARRRGDAIPALVLAGGGAPDAGLAAALDRAAARNIPVLRCSGLADGALDALYRRAWLTLYPSLGEGYGLPVAEALARGKICLAAPSGGIVEIAPGLIDPIDPHNADALVQQLEIYLDQPARLLRREAVIRASYVPTRWDKTAACVRHVLEQATKRKSKGLSPRL